jgi:hypothetical protein
MNILQFESLNLEFICKRYEINKFEKSKYEFRANLEFISRDRNDTRNYSGELDRAKSAGHHASAADRRGRTLAEAKLDEHRAQ